jgi:hypothetical protein
LNKKHLYQVSAALALLIVSMEVGCSKSYSVSSPTTFDPTSTATSVSTATAIVTATFTATSVNVATNTATAMPVIGNTNTFTATPTTTATSTITATPTNSFTPIATATNTITNTFTNTATATSTSTPTTTPTAVTFTYIYTNYIQPNSCLNCHNSGFPPDPSSQSNFYNSVVNQSAPDGCASLLVSPGNANQSALYLRLSGASCSPQMPESGGFILNAAQLADVAAWINEGALNN